MTNKDGGIPSNEPLWRIIKNADNNTTTETPVRYMVPLIQEGADYLDIPVPAEELPTVTPVTLCLQMPHNRQPVTHPLTVILPWQHISEIKIKLTFINS